MDQPTPNQFLHGDIVIRKKVQPLDCAPCFGIVVKEDLSEGSEVGPNVLWEHNNGVETTTPKQLALVDRFILRNTRVEGAEGIQGTVMDWSVTTAVQIIGTNHVVEKVELERLRPTSSLVRGQVIMYKNWVGVITIVKRRIWFVLDGGMELYVPVTEDDGFVRADPYWGVGMPCPGLRTKLRTSVIRNAKWSSRPMKILSKLFPPISYLYSKAHVTLSKSEVVGVDIIWVQKVPGTEALDLDEATPPTHLDVEMLKDVTVIGTPSSQTVGINSVRLLKLRPEDQLMNLSAWMHSFKGKYIEGIRREPIVYQVGTEGSLQSLATAEDQVFELPVKVLCRKTIVQVRWDDGTVEKLAATKIHRILEQKQDTDYPKGMIVMALDSKSDPKDLYGVVLDSERQSNSRKVNVMWILNGIQSDAKSELIYNLKPHPIYSIYKRGTIVFPRPGLESSDAVKFKAAVVIDVNIISGKMVVLVTADHTQYEIYPHLVTPLSVRCSWNPFTRAWTKDEIVLPLFQSANMELELELDISADLAERTLSKTCSSLLDLDSKPEGAVTSLNIPVEFDYEENIVDKNKKRKPEDLKPGSPTA